MKTVGDAATEDVVGSRRSSIAACLRRLSVRAAEHGVEVTDFPKLNVSSSLFIQTLTTAHLNGSALAKAFIRHEDNKRRHFRLAAKPIRIFFNKWRGLRMLAKGSSDAAVQGLMYKNIVARHWVKSGKREIGRLSQSTRRAERDGRIQTAAAQNIRGGM